MSSINWYKDTSLKIVENSTREGSGMCLQVVSNFYLTKSRPSNQSTALFIIHFIGNSAICGGTIQIVDSTYFGTCNNDSKLGRECFLQVIRSGLVHDKNNTQL